MTVSHLAGALFLGGSVALLSSCATAPGAAADGISAADRAIAKERFEQRCATCHGLDGRGHGPSSMSLNPPPRDWTDADWQADVSDGFLRVVIAEGSEAAGMSSLMPESEYADRPGVIKALIEIVRSFDG